MDRLRRLTLSVLRWWVLVAWVALRPGRVRWLRVAWFRFRSAVHRWVEPNPQHHHVEDEWVPGCGACDEDAKYWLG